MKGLRLLLLCGAALAAGCSGGTRSPDFLAESTVEKMQIFKGTTDVTDPKDAGAVNLGGTMALTARATISTTVPPGTSGAVTSCAGNAKPQPVVCEERDVTDEADWSSNNTNVATVSRGVVTGKGVGTANIFAKLGGKTAKTTVTVNPAVLLEVVVTPPDAIVSQGGTATFTAQGKYSDAPNTARDLNAGTVVNWTIAPATLATLTPTSGKSTTARASTTETGDATITATVPAGPPNGTTTDLKGTAVLHVVAANITKILELRCIPSIIRAPIPPTTPATTSQCTAFAQRSDGGTEARPASEFDWISSDDTKATVDVTGKVTGVAPGTVTITATLKTGTFPTITGANRSASAPITVTGEICTGPLLDRFGATVTTASTPLCIGCSVTDPENVIDGDESTAAVMNQTLGLLAGELSLTVNQVGGIPAGGTAGFLLRQPAGMLLSLELMNQIQVSVLKQDGSALTEVARDNTPLRLTLLGQMGDEDVFLASIDTPPASATDPAVYDALRLTFTSGVATALGQVNALAACGTVTVPTPPAP